jgi:hypothetical protein
MLLNADWGFFAPLRLCVIFALKKISLAEVFGYAPVKILNKTLASRLWRLECTSLLLLLKKPLL